MFKKKVLAILLAWGISFGSYAQEMDAKFSYAPFYNKTVGKYIETYLRLEGDSLRYIVNEDSLLESEIEVTMLFKNDNQIKEYRKYKVVGKPVYDTSTKFPDIVDLQRIVIPNGVYNFDLIIKDNHAPDTSPRLLYSDIVTVNIPGNDFAYSGVEFLESRVETITKNIFVKNGYEYRPFVGTDFGPDDHYLRAYLEIYNASKAIGPLELMVTNFTIEQAFTGKKMKGFKAHSVDRALNYNELYRYINIKDLPEGNYFLNIQTLDSLNNEVGAIQKFFTKTNTQEFDSVDVDLSKIPELFLNQDSVLHYLNCLTPIADKNESAFIESLNEKSSKEIAEFFNLFWYSRAGEHANDAWQKHLKQVSETRRKFGNDFSNPVLSAREYVYLKYGSPVSITTEQGLDGARGMETWNYLQLGDLVNRKFVFVQNANGAFNLVHSNMKGEVYNPDFQKNLQNQF